MYLSDNNIEVDSLRREIKRSNLINVLSWFIAPVVSLLVTGFIAPLFINYDGSEQKKMKPMLPEKGSTVIEEVRQLELPSIGFDRETLNEVRGLPFYAIVIDDLASALNHREIKDYFTRVGTWKKEGACLHSYPIFPEVYFTSLKVREDFINNVLKSRVFVDWSADTKYSFPDAESEPEWYVQGRSCQIGDETYYALDVFPNRKELSRVESQ